METLNLQINEDKGEQIWYLVVLHFLFIFTTGTFNLFLSKEQGKYRNIVLLVFSLIFYAWGEPVLCNFNVTIYYCHHYFIALKIERRKKGKKKWMIIDASSLI